MAPSDTDYLLSLRRLRILLGSLWLLDGLFQLQPAMFSMDMVTDIMKPMAQGQPLPILSLISWASGIVAGNIAFWNSLVAGVQLLLGFLLVFDVLGPLTLALALLWPAVVWVFGEGLGQLATGSALVLTGAPGAVLLYGLLAALSWPSGRGREEGWLPRRYAVAALAGIWLLGAGLQLQTAYLRPLGLARALAEMAGGQPGWLAALIGAAARAVGRRGPAWSVGLAAWQLLLALGLAARRREVALALSLLTAALFWIFGEAFGMLFTGMGTDPNTGPLLALLALAAWRRAPQAPAESAKLQTG